MASNGSGHQYPILSFPMSSSSIQSGSKEKTEVLTSIFGRENDLFSEDGSPRQTNYEKFMGGTASDSQMPSPTLLKGEPSMGMNPVNLFDALLMFLKTQQHTSTSLAKCRLVRLNHPDFKIGSLDALISLTDHFNSIEIAFENLLGKCRNNARALFVFAKQHIAIGPLEEELYINEEKIQDFIAHFRWSQGKFPTGRHLSDCMDSFSQELTNSDTLMKTRMSQFHLMRAEFNTLEKKHSGNLSTKPLSQVCQKYSTVLLQSSEYIETLLVAVPIDLVDHFMNTYETLTPMVVPRSALQLERDESYILFRVFVFLKTIQEYRQKLRELHFIPRDLEGIERPIRGNLEDQISLKSPSDVPSPVESSPIQTHSLQDNELALRQEELFTHFQYMLSIVRTTFSETFSSYLHFKIVKILIEDVLRYGLPPNYLTVVVLPPPEKQKVDIKALKALMCEFIEIHGLDKQLCSHHMAPSALKQESSAAPITSMIGIPQELTNAEYLPFVFEQLKCD